MWHDLTGQQFNNLLVIGRSKTPLPYAHGRVWDCKCLLCGEVKPFTTSALLQQRNLACGCLRKKYDLLGKKIDRLEVLKEVTDNRAEGRKWLCKCDCENLCVRTTAALIRPNRKHPCSCGCSIRVFKTADEANLGARYQSMLTRCYNPNSPAYHNYGGRGIYICDEWLEDRFNFIHWALSNGFKPELSIDRIDNDGPYAPWNCRWTDKFTQDNNKRVNRRVTVGDDSMTVAEWAREADLPYTQLTSFVHKYDQPKLGELIELFIRCNRTRLCVGSDVKFVREWSRILGLSDNRVAILLESGTLDNLISVIHQLARENGYEL